MKSIRAIFFLVYGLAVQAPAQSLVCQLLDASHGLPSSECVALEQDYLGHLWVGTTVGISRYNGYTFENFSHTKNNEPFGKVNVIAEDDDHLLWIGSDNGLFIKTGDGSFYKTAGSDAAPQGINDILFLAGGKVLLGSEIGPLQVSREKILAAAGSKILPLPSFQLPAWQSQRFAGDRIYHLALSADSAIYLSGPYNIYRYADRSFACVYKNDGTGSVIMSLCGINADRYYFYNAIGLFRGTRSGADRLILDEHYHPEATSKGKSVWLPAPAGALELYPDSDIVKTKLDLLPYGILWASDFLVDDQGDYWVAAHDGLVKIKRSPFEKIPFQRPSRYEEIYSLCETADGQLLMGSNRGLILTRKENHMAPPYSVVNRAEVFGIHEAYPGDLWFATGYEGLVHRVNNKNKVFTEADGLRNNSNRAFYKASDGRLFVFGDLGATQISYSPATQTVAFKNFPIDAVNSQYATLFSAIESPDKTMWFAGQEGIFKLVNDSLLAYTLDKKIISIADMKKSDQGEVWLAVDGEGIWRCGFDKQGNLKIQEKFDRTRGIATEVFNNLLIDREGNVWIGHYQGLTVIRKNKVVLNFDQNDGWPFKNYNNLFLHQDRDGMFWAGCSKGILHFNAGQMLVDANKPRIYLSAAKPSRDHSDESITLASTQPIELPYEQRELTFHYYAIAFPDQESVQYAYKFGDGAWTTVGTTRSLTFNDLSPGKYKFSIKAFTNKGASSNEVSMQITVKSPFWLTPGFILPVLGLLTIASWLWVKRREKMIYASEQQKRAREVEMISLQHDLAHSRLTALRSQMNPHFIFNALNSIQQFVLQGNVEEASRYLGMFSLLHREILNTSDENFISLQREIDMLDKYMQLEQLRFDDSFRYSIHMEGDIDTEEIRIPPMLIQPFVENAIWHGLMPKEGTKRVEILFNLQSPGDVLVCAIKDNGIGREASAQLKAVNGSLKSHKPKGLKLISDRIGMLRQRYQLPFTVDVADLRDDENKVAGTVVIVKLSLETNGQHF
ncbi:Y_Y_Y domain-containing protein [Chryseolinea serpens]|uniref:Y_Y_Y domain-containing protein n=1 Tax=Chryseolinea serpens TaxID=947013 RepID=A0A1M5P183_9BACT|nr:histidine kinase [Chryseolinea serpens]SHG95467.1 Y_Y_Y domain-containing protein [Chryseolinea serpens]